MAKLTIRIDASKAVANVRQRAIAVAKREHARIMEAEPRPIGFKRYVDLVEGAPEEALKEGGFILYQYNRLDRVVQYALEALFELSPVDSGEYRQSHQLFVNGQPASNLKDFRLGDEISISNPLPYARKIELGTMKMRVPGTDRVYQQAAKKVRRRFGNVATIKFTYRAFLGGGQVNQAMAASTGKSWWLGHSGEARAASGLFESAIGKKFGKTAHNRSNTRFPALIITQAGDQPARRR